jgi:hypothetical protein
MFSVLVSRRPSIRRLTAKATGMMKRPYREAKAIAPAAAHPMSMVLSLMPVLCTIAWAAGTILPSSAPSSTLIMTKAMPINTPDFRALEAF